MPQPPKIHSRRAVPNSQYFKVEAAELEFSNVWYWRQRIRVVFAKR